MGNANIAPGVEDLITAEPPVPTESAIAAATRKYNLERGVAQPPTYSYEGAVASGKRPDIDLDTSTGIPKTLRWKLSFAPSLAGQVGILESEYGKGNVVMAGNGELIVRNVRDAQTGKVKDLQVNPFGADWGDLSAVGPAALQVAGAAIAIKAGNKLVPMPKSDWLRRLANISFGAVGAETPNVLEDLGVRIGYDLPIEPAHIAEESGTRMLLNAAFDLGLTGLGSFVAKLPSRLWAPLQGHLPPLQQKGLESAITLEKATGVKYPWSTGELTGRPLIQRTEAFAETLGGGGYMAELTAKQGEALAQIRDVMLGNRPLGSAQDIGARAVNFLETSLAKTRETGSQLKLDALRQASNDLLDSISPMPVQARMLYERNIGQAVRGRVLGELQAWKEANTANYAEVYQVPGGMAPVFPTRALKATAQEIEQNLPKLTARVADLSNMVDAEGKPITTWTEQQKLLREFIPPRLGNMLAEAGKLNDRMPLNQLVQMRNILSDSIAEGEAMPGIGTRYLKQFRNGLTQAIDDGIKELEAGTPKLKIAWRNLETDTTYISKQPMHAMAATDKGAPSWIGGPNTVKGFALPDGTFYSNADIDSVMAAFNNGKGIAASLKKANEAYKVGRDRFEAPGIPELLTPPKAPGYMYDAQLVERVVGGRGNPDLLNAYKTFLGETSPEYRLLKQSMLDNMAYKAAGVEGGVIDGKRFYDQLMGLDREVLSELLGPRAYDTLQMAKDLGRIQGRINMGEFENIVRMGPAAIGKFKTAFEAQAKADALYRNEIVQKFTRGADPTALASIQPGEFVEKFVTAADPPQVAQVMHLIHGADPQLEQDIKAKVLERVFQQLDWGNKPINMQMLKARAMNLPEKDLAAATTFSPQRLRDLVFSDERTAQQYQAVLGGKTLNNLEQLGNLLAVRLQKDEAGKVVGGLAAGGIISRLMTFDLHELDNIAKYRVLSYALSKPGIGRWLTHTMPRPETEELTKMLIMSAPMLQAGGRTFATEAGFTQYMQLLFNAAHGTYEQGQTEQEPHPNTVAPGVEQLIR